MSVLLAAMGLALLVVTGCVVIARHERALAWRRDVAAAIEIAHSYKKGARR